MLEHFSVIQFRRGHAAFLSHMQREGGVPFTGFGHPFLVDDEIAYKWRIRHEGRTRLQLDKWARWAREHGHILRATREACHGNVSGNLLEHRFGPKGNSDSPLYGVRTREAIKSLEEQLYNFLLGGSSRPEDVGPRFDRFADFLRAEKLGCKWPFLAYLLFLLSPQTYFPILPGRFDRLLEFYGLSPTLVGRVEWSRYLLVLRLADRLRELLAAYGTPDAIQLQSYMWVVSYLVTRSAIPPDPAVDLDAERKAREHLAAERERVGLEGERHVYTAEVEKLISAKRGDLAAKVSFTSIDDPSAGFDILSFQPTGEELHIEVKTTSRPKAFDMGFWLTPWEHATATADPRWTLYRVWDIDNAPETSDLGNVVQALPGGWSITPGSWYFTPPPRIDGA